MPPVTASIQVRGLKQLDALLARLPDEVEGAIMEAALREAGEVIHRAAQDNIRSRTGRTAADLRMEVQVEPGRRQGVAAIGGTRKGTTGRAHVLRWLEFGTKAHVIVAGEQDRRDARRAARALRAIGETGAARALRRGVRAGTIRTRRALKLPNGLFRAIANHPGMRAQSPLTRALAEQGDTALRVFRDGLWSRIVAFTRGARRAA